MRKSIHSDGPETIGGETVSRDVGGQSARIFEGMGPTISAGPRTRASFVVASLLLAMCTTSPAKASDDQERSVIVRTSDLNLRSAGGVRELGRRIHRAARSVCPPRSWPFLVQANRCIKRAEKEAWQTVQSRRLTAEEAEASLPAEAQATDRFGKPNR